MLTITLKPAKIKPNFGIRLMRLNTNLYNRHHVTRHHDDRWPERVQEQVQRRRHVRHEVLKPEVPDTVQSTTAAVLQTGSPKHVQADRDRNQTQHYTGKLSSKFGTKYLKTVEGLIKSIIFSE